MATFMVTIVKAGDDPRTPDDWPITQIDAVIEASDDEQAEEIADDMIAAILKARNAQYAMVIDSTVEV